ncbi:MAG: ABC transporter substrate-binding protein [Sulfolobales archaeon]
MIRIRTRVIPIAKGLACFVLLALVFISITGSAAQGLLLVAEAQARPRLSFEMLSLPWFPLSDKAAEVVAEQLRRVGIEVRIVKLESSVMYPRIMNTFDYDSFALAVSQSPDPTGMLNSMHSRNAIPGGSNYWGYANPEVDKLIDMVLTAKSEEEAKKLAWKIQELVSNGPFIPLYLSINTQVIRAEWKNYTLMPGGIIEAYNRWSMLYMYKSDRLEENIFRIAFPADILSLNPFMATDLRSLWVIAQIYDPLVALSPDLKPIPWLAERWEISPDGLNYTFYLRKGVKFHDGSELTADDVVFTYKFGISNKAPRYLGTVTALIKDIEKIDNYTVRFILKDPSPFFLVSLATSFQFIVPKKIWEDQNVTWANPNPIGTGPFKFVSRTPGESIVLERNPDYFKGAPKIFRVVVRVIPEAETRYYSIKRGDVDTERYATSFTLIPDAEKDPNLRVIKTPDIWLIYIAFNYRRYNDTRIFEAINYAIDRDEIIKRAAGGYGVPVYTILNKEWHGEYANTNITFKYDPERAIKILEEAGWFPGPDGIRIYVGERQTTATTPQTTPTTIPTTTPITPTPTVTTPTPQATPAPPATPGIVAEQGIIVMVVIATIIIILAVVVATKIFRRRP